MEQQVYMDLETYNGIRLMQQTSEDQIHQQQYQQGIIMSGGDQQPEVIIQDDSQQHIVYSPMKQNEQGQYIESLQGQQYLIQSPGQQPQVVYANISPQNQIRNQQQTIQLNHNLIAQQNQSQQKVNIYREITRFSTRFANIFFNFSPVCSSSGLAKSCRAAQSWYSAVSSEHGSNRWSFKPTDSVFDHTNGPEPDSTIHYSATASADQANDLSTAAESSELA